MALRGIYIQAPKNFHTWSIWYIGHMLTVAGSTFKKLNSTGRMSPSYAYYFSFPEQRGRRGQLMELGIAGLKQGLPNHRIRRTSRMGGRVVWHDPYPSGPVDSDPTIDSSALLSSWRWMVPEQKHFTLSPQGLQSFWHPYQPTLPDWYQWWCNLLH